MIKIEIKKNDIDRYYIELEDALHDLHLSENILFAREDFNDDEFKELYKPKGVINLMDDKLDSIIKAQDAIHYCLRTISNLLDNIGRDLKMDGLTEELDGAIEEVNNHMERAKEV